MVGIRHIIGIGGMALAIAALPAPASACRTGCGTSSGSTGGSSGATEVPAPAGLALFGVAAMGLVAKRRRRNA